MITNCVRMLFFLIGEFGSETNDFNINDVIDIRIRMNYAENVWDILPNCNISLQKLKEAWKNLCY